MRHLALPQPPQPLDRGGDGRDAVAALDAAFARALDVAVWIAETPADDDPATRKSLRLRTQAAAVVIGAWARIMAGTGRRPMPETPMTGPLAGPSVEQLEERDRQARALLASPSPELREALEEAGWQEVER